MMKILFTIDSMANAGTENSMAAIMAQMPASAQKVVVYFYPEHTLLPSYQATGAEIVFVPLKGEWDLVKGTKQLITILQSAKPNVVVSSLYRSSIMSRFACKFVGIPLVDTFVNDTYGAARIAELKQTRYYWKFTLTWLVDALTAKLCTNWLANSQSIAISNAKALRIPAKKVQVIYRGRDVSHFTAWQNMPTAAFGAQQPFVLIGIGRLISRKGFAELITAMQQVVALHPFVQLRIYGEGDQRKALTQQIVAAGLQNHITLCGNVPNAWQQLYQGHCFVFPSWYEGFSGALIEGMLTGIPTVASNISMNLEAVEHNVTARVFEVQNATALANEILWVINHYSDACSLGAAARKLALDTYNIAHIANQYYRYLAGVANK